MTAASTLEPAPPPADPETKLRWWQEALYVVVFYAGYTLVRDLRGTRPVSRAHAFANAEKIVDLERWFGLFQERRVQSWFLHSHAVLRGLDDFYGTAHFAVTLVALMYLFHRQPWRYSLWRNTLAITTALALIGFAFFPLMPPRLLPSSYHIVDTLRTVGGLWSFDSGPMNAVSNQYAAMPSLHFAWSMWCALALAPAMKRPIARVLVWCYPALTLLCVVVTGNHYLVDALGGAVTLAAGYGGARVIATAVRNHHDAAHSPSGRPGAVAT
ncbi:MAG: phosphatase PAP2 family protein [Actinomycetota bacterium]|nr:phosphatase PAP2 family protein [Actinomycetota bacterium]